MEMIQIYSQVIDTSKLQAGEIRALDLIRDSPNDEPLCAVRIQYSTHINGLLHMSMHQVAEIEWDWLVNAVKTVWEVQSQAA